MTLPQSEVPFKPWLKSATIAISEPANADEEGVTETLLSSAMLLTKSVAMYACRSGPWST